MEMRPDSRSQLLEQFMLPDCISSAPPLMSNESCVITAELLMETAAWLPTRKGRVTVNGVPRGTSTSSNRLDEPTGAEIAKMRTERFVNAVAESIVIVLLPALVIRVGSKLELLFGAEASDQLVATPQRPPAVLVQLFGRANSDNCPNSNQAPPT